MSRYVKTFPLSAGYYGYEAGDDAMDMIKSVQTMQEYIRQHFQDDDFSVSKVCKAAGYSRRHGDRIFKEYTGKTLQDYISRVRLTQSAGQLLKTQSSILDIALASHFQSHEGFTRSFTKYFQITPSEYRETRIALPLFIQYPVTDYRAICSYKEETAMKDEVCLCMITVQERPERKLIYLPCKNAHDYLSYCEEMGCEWEGLLNSIPEKFDTAALIRLPQTLSAAESSPTAAGVEVPADYDKPLPAGYKVSALPSCKMLYFQSEPYEEEEDFIKAIETAVIAIGKYNPAQYGYRFAEDIAPSFNFGADTATGARMAVPVLPIEG